MLAIRRAVMPFGYRARRSMYSAWKGVRRSVTIGYRPAPRPPHCCYAQNLSNKSGHRRLFLRTHSSIASPEIEGKEENNAETVQVTYIDRDGEHHVINGKVGDNVMYLAQRHDLDVEGACEASLACCTCHVYVKEKFYDMLGEPTEEEEDMLDLAPFLQENSRLSCQIILSKEIDGIEVQLPSATRNFYVDGHKPKPH